MLHVRSNPSDCYSRVDLDARIEGSSGSALTIICFDALLGAFGRARLAAERGARSDVIGALSRAASVLGGLQRSVDTNAPMGDVLRDFYGSISLRVRDVMKQPSASEIANLQRDVAEVSAALFPRSNLPSQQAPL